MSKRPLQIALAITFLSAATPAQNLTPAEQQQALKLLNDSRNGVSDAVKGLSETQWKFKPAPDRWSVAEVVEHLALIEDLVQQGVFPNLEKAPAGTADGSKQMDGALLTKLADRSTKYHAPEPAVPTGRWTPAEALEHFYAARQNHRVSEGKPRSAATCHRTCGARETRWLSMGARGGGA